MARARRGHALNHHSPPRRGSDCQSINTASANQWNFSRAEGSILRQRAAIESFACSSERVILPGIESKTMWTGTSEWLAKASLVRVNSPHFSEQTGICSIAAKRQPPLCTVYGVCYHSCDLAAGATGAPLTEWVSARRATEVARSRTVPRVVCRRQKLRFFYV
jgi:hypothetical protein